VTLNFRHKLLNGLFLFALLSIFAGCAQIDKVRERIPFLKKGTPAASKAGYYEHTVRWPGESLSIIAKWYTGNLENWKVLAKANPKLNPSVIHIGQKVFIPEDLLKTRQSMPKRFVEGFSPSASKKPQASKRTPPPPSEKAETGLYGPKPYPEK
jgi:hypothetical protein